MRSVRYITRCRSCGATSSTLTTDLGRGSEDRGRLVIDEKGESGIIGAYALRCACGKLNRVNPVRGKYKASVECNSKCHNSKSGICECSCGGKNHGSGYGA